MDLIEVWDKILKGEKVTAKGISAKNVAMLQNRASTYKAIEKRRSKRAELLGREVETSILRHELYYRAAVYYRKHYLNKGLDADTEAWHDHDKTRQTKQSNYIIKRYEKAIADAKKKCGGAPSDDELMLYLFSLMPQTAFEPSELDIWKCIFEYAKTVQADYTAVKRSNHRATQPFHGTYLEFLGWLAQNGDCSSKDKDFVARMTVHYGLPSAKKADTLLRYYSSMECFGEGDFAALGLTTQQQIDEFFEVLDAINSIRKK